MPKLTPAEAYYITDLLIALAATLLTCVLILTFLMGARKILLKDGRRGWHAFVPFLNVYELGLVGAHSKWAAVTAMICSVATAVCGLLNLFLVTLPLEQGIAGPEAELNIAYMVISLIFAVAFIPICLNISRFTGRGKLFAAGLFFIPSLFFLIAGYSAPGRSRSGR